MRKAIIFIIQLAFIIGVAMLLINYQEPMSISLGEYTLNTSSTFVILFAFVLIGLYTIFYKILEGVAYAPKRIKKHFNVSHHIKGLDAIANGLFYLTTKNNKQAVKESRRASKYLSQHKMTHFLSAKSYFSDGNFKKAKKEYRKIISSDKDVSLGFNGLIEIAVIENKESEIFPLCKQAILMDKKNYFALLTMIDYQLNSEDFDGAKTNIAKAVKAKVMSKEEAKNKLAEISYNDSLNYKAQNKLDKAIKEIAPYISLDLRYLGLYIDLLLDNEQSKKAQNTIMKEWQKNPFYSIALLWSELGPDNVFEKVKHNKKLLKAWPDSHIAFELIAKACVDAEIWGEARDYITKAIETEEKISHLFLMAKVEKHGFKNNNQHEFWLKKAENFIFKNKL